MTLADLSDHPFSQESIAYECGGDSPSDRRWYAFCRKVEALIGVDLDGDEDEDGYSIDGAYAAWEVGVSPAEYAAEVRAARVALGLGS